MKLFCFVYVLKKNNAMKIKIAICKKTKKEFKDYKNSSGILTQHLLDVYPEIVHPSTFKKRQYKLKNNKYWHEQYFDIVEKDVQKIKTKKCKYCDWETKDLDNKSGQYTLHLKKEHNISIEGYLKEFPNESCFFKTQKIKYEKEKILNSSENNYITCKICGKRLKYMTNTHLKKHNLTIDEYKINFSQENTISNEYYKKLKTNYNSTLKYCSNNFTSNAQKQILDLLKQNGIICKSNDKKLLNGIEIDILSYEFKIGIEYNGNFYHTEKQGNKNKAYHINKTRLANEKGFSLIHIFEDEWEFKQNIVKSKLLHIFNKANYEKKIYARKCIVKEIDSSVKNVFLNKYHIQGEDRSNLSLGAYHKNELIAIMTFDNIRQMSGKNNPNTYELKRFCSIENCLVIGIAGKFLSYFIKNYNPQKIISFADRRWTLNPETNLYTKLNFKLVKTLPPDYSYYNPQIKRNKRFHKFSFGKSSLKKKYPLIYKDEKTEWEMMQELGYDRIWDCGKFKYELNL